MPHGLLHVLGRGSQHVCNFVSICLQVTRYAAVYGIKYVALSNYEGTIFGMFQAPHQLLLSKLIKFDDTAPSVLEVRTVARQCQQIATYTVNLYVALHLSMVMSQFTAANGTWNCSAYMPSPPGQARRIGISLGSPARNMHHLKRLLGMLPTLGATT